jgi:hypothetical protein
VVLLFLPWTASAHPGIGLVRDSKGAIFYSDLEQVWRLKDGKKTVAVANVHTHELFIDANDNLYGEHLWFIGGNNDFMHYLWVLRANGSLDTIVPPRLAYRQVDYSLARDPQGNVFYVKAFVTAPDTSHIFRRDKNGHETIIASGNFKEVKWLNPQADGSILFVLGNSVHKISRNGKNKQIFPFGNTTSTLGGAWKDGTGGIYVALFHDRIIKKLAAGASPTTIYSSPRGWSPVFGLYDADNVLWVLEYSEANAVRVVRADEPQNRNGSTAGQFPGPGLLTALLLLSAGVVYQWIERRKVPDRAN